MTPIDSWVSSHISRSRALFNQLCGSPVVRNALWMYVVQFTGYVIPLLTLPYLSRVLSVEHFGQIALAQSLAWNFTILTEYGFNLSATRQVAVNRDNPAVLCDLFSAVMTAKTILATGGLCLLMGIVFAVAELRRNWDLFLIAYLSVTGSLFFPAWLYQGLEKMKHIAFRDFVAKAVGLVLLFALVRSDADYRWAAFSQSVGLLFGGIVGLASVPFIVPVRFALPKWIDVREAFRTGWPPFLSMAAAALTTSTNLLILGLRGANAEIAYFNGANRLTSFMRSLVGPMSTAVYSHVCRKAARSEGEAISFVKKYGWLLSSPFLLMSVISMAAAPWVTAFVLGPKYAAATPVLQVLSLGPFLVAIGHVYSTYYMLACGYDKQWMRIMLANVAVNFAVFIPLLFLIRGALALAITMTVMETVAAVAYGLFYRKQSRTYYAEHAARISV